MGGAPPSPLADQPADQAPTPVQVAGIPWYKVCFYLWCLMNGEKPEIPEPPPPPPIERPEPPPRRSGS